MSNSFKTFLKHTAKDFHNQSVNPPVVRASTIIFKSMQDIRKTQAKAQKNPIGGHYDYGRQGTSTTHVLQKINTEYSLDLFNRLIIGVYRLGRLNFYTKQVIQKQIAKGEISAEDLFVDLSISTGNALTHMLKPIHQSWFYSSRHA